MKIVTDSALTKPEFASESQLIGVSSDRKLEILNKTTAQFFVVCKELGLTTFRPTPVSPSNAWYENCETPIA